MKKFCIIILSVCSYCNLCSQTLGNPNSGLDMNTAPAAGFIQEVSSNQVITKGTIYLFDTWETREVSVNGKPFAAIRINYNLQNNGFEYMNEADQIMRVTSGRVDFVKDYLGNVYYESRRFKTSEGAPLVGVLREITAPAEWQLVAHYYMVVSEPTYIAALDAGSKATTYSRKQEYYIASDGVLYKLDNNKKKVAAQFGDRADKVLAFLKENKVDLKDEKDQRKFVEFLNSQWGA